MSNESPVNWPAKSDGVSAKLDPNAFSMRMKRALDILGAGAGIIVSGLPMLVVGVLVRVKLGPPVIFRQARPGLNEVPFEMMKFRTMSNERDGTGALLSDAQRLTALGGLLRRTSIDELPALFNVLKGDMSLVGPRPLLFRYGPYYRPDERLRFSMKPGMTGLSQVHGRNNSGWDERLAMDRWYVSNWTPLLDVKILVRTVGAVVMGSGVQVIPNEAMLSLDEERSREV